MWFKGFSKNKISSVNKNLQNVNFICKFSNDFGIFNYEQHFSIRFMFLYFINFSQLFSNNEESLIWFFLVMSRELCVLNKSEYKLQLCCQVLCWNIFMCVKCRNLLYIERRLKGCERKKFNVNSLKQAFRD